MKSRLLMKQRLANLKENGELWHVLLLVLFFIIGGSMTYYVTQSQDAEMRDTLTTYANTIERSIDWRPFENVLNTNPNNLNATDLNGLNAQLNDACKRIRNHLSGIMRWKWISGVNWSASWAGNGRPIG